MKSYFGYEILFFSSFSPVGFVKYPKIVKIRHFYKPISIERYLLRLGEGNPTTKTRRQK